MSGNRCISFHTSILDKPDDTTINRKERKKLYRLFSFDRIASANNIKGHHYLAEQHD